MFQRMLPPGWSHAPTNYMGGISVNTPRFFPVSIQVQCDNWRKALALVGDAVRASNLHPEVIDFGGARRFRILRSRPRL